jgi:CelD/BcsL family acetyltransferase involved in cellulose biosynthesis
MTIAAHGAASSSELPAAGPAAAAGADAAAATLTVTTTSRIDDVEAVWRRLERMGVESPGQSFDFIRLWIQALGVREADQLFIVATLGAQPLALLPLQRFRRAGASHFGWFPGTHVGCGAPLIDAGRFAQLSASERAGLWQQVARIARGADFIHLADVPATANGLDSPFAELGRVVPTETLYRAAFSSWEEANVTQRSKSRRKHDRQQGERLDALGEVAFEVVGNGPEALPVLEEMFRQRARRFEVMGVADPFAAPAIARFYRDTVATDSAVRVRLHVLRLDGAIVAVRYNIVFGDRLFCLISSMSDDERIQGGSPGKQCLLRVMQTEFDAGVRIFDMGNGFTDEKRHWCNARVPLASHYVPLTAKGRLLIEGDAAWRKTKAAIKANPALLRIAKTLRQLRARGAAPAAASSTDPED